MNYYGFSSLFNGVVVLAVGFYLLSRQKQSSLYQSFAVFSACVGLWCVFYSFWQAQTTRSDALMYMRLAMIPCYCIPYAFFWFVLTLVGIPKKSWWLILTIGIPLFFMLFGFSRYMISDMEPKLNFPFWSVPGTLMHFNVFLFCVIVFLSYGILFHFYRRSSGIQKWQIKWVGLSLLPGWLGGATNWFLWYDIPVPPVAHFFIGAGFLVLAYAIVRARLFDVEALADYIQEAKLSALGIMATSINHEVRNPLFVIKAMAETQLERLENPSLLDPTQKQVTIKEMLEKTIQQTDRALGIIRNFSAYAKRQSSRTFDAQMLDLREIVEGIVPFVQSELALDNIRLEIEIPVKTMVCADRHSLEEIFLNLIVNAVQAVKETGEAGEIRVAAAVITKKSPVIAKESQRDDCGNLNSFKPFGSPRDDKVTITIQDNGPGMDPDKAAHAFQPFYTTKPDGTGLGLYVVKQLVEKNHGRISVESQLGRGTTFTVTLPCSEVQP